MRLPCKMSIVLCNSCPVKNTLGRSRLRLITAHRILIASGIAVCLVYAGRAVANYLDTHSIATLIHAALAVAAAVALALYLRSIRTL